MVAFYMATFCAGKCVADTETIGIRIDLLSVGRFDFINVCHTLSSYATMCWSP